MAELYRYEKVVSTAGQNFARKNRAKARKALIKKKLTDNMVDDFLDACENSAKLRTAMTDLIAARSAASNKVLGSDALFKARNPVSKKLFAQIVGRQLQLKFKDVSLEIHRQGGNLQLWYNAKGGRAQVLVDHKSTRA